nr:ORF9 [Bat coronavirus]
MRVLILLSLLSVALTAAPEIHHYIDCVRGTSTTILQPCDGVIESTSPVQFTPNTQYGSLAVSCSLVTQIRISCPHGNHTFHVRPVSFRTHTRYSQPQGNELQCLIVTLLIVIVLYLFFRRR